MINPNFDDRNTCQIYTYQYVDKTCFWIVRIPCKSVTHEKKIMDWLFSTFGVEYASGWSLGAVCTNMWQEYWFDHEHMATQTYLTWLNN